MSKPRSAHRPADDTDDDGTLPRAKGRLLAFRPLLKQRVELVQRRNGRTKDDAEIILKPLVGFPF